ncbi:von Willebrand factor type A domain-containing protein [Lasiosphaeria ovina]|uniref:von Willebrand factor type A domain-containing protein n=1 Tax=Lasiosphaeria ovina TaxID=92902 RepID=A0AAE0N125_9PEZI|nr:von Willebrand factor type A domain-containing protein [Lasiosphaeria ovina]
MQLALAILLMLPFSFAQPAEEKQAPWMCGGVSPNPQSILQLHENWHCTNKNGVPENFGNRFFGFHKQFLQGFNTFRASHGYPLVQAWEPYQGAVIPIGHKGRPDGATCGTCIPRPLEFRAPPQGTLDTWATLDALGNAIISWHDGNHGRLAAAGGSGNCDGGGPDIGCPAWAPADPILYPYHHIFDEIQDDWRKLKPADVAIVLDRSGSMDLKLKDTTRLEAAKAAAGLFADLVDEDGGHKVGMVSFSTQASSTPDMPLTPAAAAPAALAAALSGLVASGLTSIGDGLIKGQGLVDTGAEARKAILLLTDGDENQGPKIVDAYKVLGDTHVCSVGLGTPMTLNGPKLQQLSERQGGIYISTPDDLALKKYFVFCFANIFDSFVAEDPLDTLGPSELVSPPTVHRAQGDEKITFVLGWSGGNNTASDGLRLAITTPSGSVLDLDGRPGVTSKIGPSWHVVKVKTPYDGETDGDWVARAVRPVHAYVNGFTSRSFVNFTQGLDLFRFELSTICGPGYVRCRNILYWEDLPPPPFLAFSRLSFESQSSIYAAGLLQMAGRGILGNVTKPQSATEFARALGDVEKYDLVVYSSQFTNESQPYDGPLADALCSKRVRAIVSDNRRTSGAARILSCNHSFPSLRYTLERTSLFNHLPDRSSNHGRCRLQNEKLGEILYERPQPVPGLEALPSELILCIRDFLPPASRVARALTSSTIMKFEKGTRNRVGDWYNSHDRDPIGDDHPSHSDRFKSATRHFSSAAIAANCSTARPTHCTVYSAPVMTPSSEWYTPSVPCPPTINGPRRCQETPARLSE